MTDFCRVLESQDYATVSLVSSVDIGVNKIIRGTCCLAFAANKNLHFGDKGPSTAGFKQIYGGLRATDFGSIGPSTALGA